MLLADTSVWAWTRRPGVDQLRGRFDDAVIAGEIATCDMVRFELLHSARDPAEFEQASAELDAVPCCRLGAAEWSRALQVYGELAAQGGGQHRRVGHQDLLIAAAAESAGVGVLHYDSDYELIGAVTGQPMRWLAPKGSLP